MSHIPGIPEDLKRGITLSPLQDSFYKDNMYQRYDAVAESIKGISDQLQKQSSSRAKLQTLEDIKNFLTEFPELTKLQGSVSKHATLIGEIQKQIRDRQLLDCSELEQHLASENEKDAHIASLRTLLTGEGKVDENGQTVPFKPLMKEDAIRLVLLFALRYEQEAPQEIQMFTRLLQDRYELTTAQQGLLNLIRSYSGAQVRSPSTDLFGNNITFKSFTNTMFKGVGLQEVTSVFQRYKPLIERLATVISENTLSDVDFPFAGPVGNTRPVEVIFFFVGGATFQESAVVNALNSPSNPTKSQYLLGGTSITAPYTFLRELEQLFLQGGGGGR